MERHSRAIRAQAPLFGLANESNVHTSVRPEEIHLAKGHLLFGAHGIRRLNVQLHISVAHFSDKHSFTRLPHL